MRLDRTAHLPDDFVLGMVEFSENGEQRVHYLRRPFQREETFIDEIVETLKSVPKTRLRIVRDVVGALAEPAVRDKDRTKLNPTPKSLPKAPFCGMWEGRTDVGNGRSYARGLRRGLESRGDRT